MKLCAALAISFVVSIGVFSHTAAFSAPAPKKKVPKISDRVPEGLEPEADWDSDIKYRSRDEENRVRARTSVLVPSVAGGPPEVVPNSRSHLKYRRLDEEDRIRAQTTGFIGNNAQPSFSATIPGGLQPEVVPGSHLKYRRLDEEDRIRAQTTGFTGNNSKPSFSATIPGGLQPEVIPGSHLKYRRLDEEDRIRAQNSAFTSNSRATFSATIPGGLQSEVVPGSHLKYKRLDEEDRVRAKGSVFAAASAGGPPEMNPNTRSHLKYKRLNDDYLVGDQAINSRNRPTTTDDDVRSKEVSVTSKKYVDKVKEAATKRI